MAAPREVWASALKASEPASRIAAIAMKVSLRIDSLPVGHIAGDSKRANCARSAGKNPVKEF
jgi:hypothetical protein